MPKFIVIFEADDEEQLKAALTLLPHYFTPDSIEEVHSSVREVAKQRGFKPITSTREDERFDQATRF